VLKWAIGIPGPGYPTKYKETQHCRQKSIDERIGRGHGSVPKVFFETEQAIFWRRAFITQLDIS
jgi:hypothetical protein